jgi:hypothetical protein
MSSTKNNKTVRKINRMTTIKQKRKMGFLLMDSKILKKE